MSCSRKYVSGSANDQSKSSESALRQDLSEPDEEVEDEDEDTETVELGMIQQRRYMHFEARQFLVVT